MTDKMKILLNSKDKNAVNLANVIGISVSNNYLILALIDGREMRFIFGTTRELDALFDAIMAFLADDDTKAFGAKVFDCYEFINNL